MATDDGSVHTRADPDALLALAGRPGRGRLTVFLGAAPGVGKTFAMLGKAQRARAEGFDIVVGLVETHGRSETAALIHGLEILPRLTIAYRDRTVEEFDLDAALLRKPAVLVVDELAHSNPPGSRHPKRYQDVEELLRAGIDVWTALNIQHLESLTDVVSQITGVVVREQVPDIVLKRADEILLIDLPPAELIERLKQGKVYLPDNARRAENGYFRLGNLTALRDLALRRTADRVDDQMIDYLKQNAIEGPWLSAERLLVCIGPDTLSEKVLRTASRLASGLNAHWLVVSLEQGGAAPSLENDRKIESAFRLAERLGAETRRIKGNDFVAEILKVVRREHATQIVIGGNPLSPLRRLFSRSLPDAVIRRARGIDVHVVTSDEDEAWSWPFRFVKPRLRGRKIVADLAIAIGTVTVSTIAGHAILAYVDLPNVSIIFLLAVLASATLAGYTASLLAALLSALAYNFFFIEPFGSLTIAEPHEVFALLVFVIAAFLAGGAASRLREQVKISAARAMATQALYDFSRKLSGTAKLDDVFWVVVTQLHGAFNRDVVLLDGEGPDLALRAAWPPDAELGVAENAAARWAKEKAETAGQTTSTLPNSSFRFIPLTTPHGVVCVCGIRIGPAAFESSDSRMLDAILDQTAIAIDRARLSKARLEQAAAIEGGRLRSALLASVSHDLKTPLATITGAVTSLRQLGEKMSARSRDDLLRSIDEESGRLTRFLANLLDMTRIDSGTIDAKREWVDVADVVRAAADRARSAFPERILEIKLAADLPLIKGDSILLGQALFNVLDNANKFGGDEPITVYVRESKPFVVMSVVDMGKGIAARDLDRIFDKFYRRAKSDGRAPGTGLGLAIAKGFVEAMGGTIKAESPAVKKRGTRVTLTLPAELLPASVEQ